MLNLFEGLEKYGFNEIDKMNLFASEDKANNGTVAAEEVKPESFLYFKEFECPSCDKKFKNAVVKCRMARYVRSDTDLRMYFDPIDPMYYDVILCTHCGYAAVSAMFNRLTSRQMEKVKAGISSKYKPREYPLLLSLEQAIDRYKMALLNTCVKDGRDGEKAYICLKLAWLYRVAPDEKRELAFLESTLTGFERAYSKERFPICGIDEMTIIYLLADISRRLGNNSDALKYLGRIIGNRAAPRNIKDRASTIRDMIRESEKSKNIPEPQPKPPQPQAKTQRQPLPQQQATASSKRGSFLTLPSIIRKK